MIHRCWLMRKIVNDINQNVFEGRVEPLIKNCSIKSTSFCLTPQKIPQHMGTGMHTSTRTAAQGRTFQFNTLWQESAEGRFSEVAVLTSWSTSESPTMLVKCRFPGPTPRNSDSVYLEWSPGICMWNQPSKPFCCRWSTDHTLRNTPLRDPIEVISSLSESCSCQLGFTSSIRGFY